MRELASRWSKETLRSAAGTARIAKEIMNGGSGNRAVLGGEMFWIENDSFCGKIDKKSVKSNNYEDIHIPAFFDAYDDDSDNFRTNAAD